MRAQVIERVGTDSRALAACDPEHVSTCVIAVFFVFVSTRESGLLVYGLSWHLGPVCAGVNLRQFYHSSSPIRK